MTKREFYPDDFDELEDYDLRLKAERPRKLKATKKQPGHNVAELAEPVGLEGGFKITYKPAIYEEGWLRDSIRSFYDQHFIVDVLAQLKGGKEASVYRCKADASVGQEFLAAKVYRPRQFRNLSNDKMYRQGRPILTGEGRVIKTTDHRIMRALGKKTGFGMQVQHSSWLLYEYTTLQKLYELGANVPQPMSVNENAILMSYFGNPHQAARTLSEISLEKEEAEVLFRQVLRNIELMLEQDLIHGDLSAYNILYWEGQIILIDFPQVVNSQANREAKFILKRDIVRVCDYFARHGVDCNAEAIASELWERYTGQDINDLTPDPTTIPEIEEE